MGHRNRGCSYGDEIERETRSGRRGCGASDPRRVVSGGVEAKGTPSALRNENRVSRADSEETRLRGRRHRSTVCIVYANRGAGLRETIFRHCFKSGTRNTTTVARDFRTRQEKFKIQEKKTKFLRTKTEISKLSSSDEYELSSTDRLLNMYTRCWQTLAIPRKTQ